MCGNCFWWLETWILVPADLGFWYYWSPTILVLSWGGLLLYLDTCFLRQKSQIWLVPAGDRFFCSAKPCSNRAHGRGEGESVWKTQWAAIREKNWGERIKEIKQVFNTSVSLRHRDCKLLVQIHPWFFPLHPSQWDLNEGQTMQTNSLNHLCLSLSRAVFFIAWVAPGHCDGAFWSTAVFLWGLGICQSCHLWRGLLAVMPKVVWVCKTAGTESKSWWVFVMEELLPQRDRTDGQCWVWLKCCWSLQLGERLERGMLSLEVPLWSLLAFVGSQQLKEEKGIFGCRHLGPSLAATSAGLSHLLVLTGTDKQEWTGDSPAQ